MCDGAVPRGAWRSGDDSIRVTERSVARSRKRA
jgi:hypothetical protein